MENTNVKTIPELTAKVAELSVSLDAKAVEYNEASLNSDFRKMVEIDNSMKELEKKYTEVAQTLLFSQLKEKEHPMLEAIKAHSFETSKHKDTAEAGSTVKTREMTTVLRQFDLKEFDSFCGGTASANKYWSNLAEQMNMIVCMRVANDLKVTDLESIGTSYFLTKTKADIKLAEENPDVANPVSNAQMLKLMQKVLDKIIYEDNGKDSNKYKALSQDVAWLMFTYGRKDTRGKLTLKLVDHKQFRKILADVLHRIATGESYKVAYKQMISK